MLILGIESSSLVASAALVKDGVLLAEYTLNSKKTHSQTLLPMIKEIVDEVLDGDLSGIDGIAISKGPGSFTGLRIGSATAKGLAFTLDKPIMAIPTMDAMAYGLYGAEGLVCPIMDARRKQVYTGLYVFEEVNGEPAHVKSPVAMGRPTSRDKLGTINGKYEMKTIIPQTAMDLGELMEFLNSNGQPVIFLGDACQVYEDDILSGMTAPFTFAPSFAARQRASVVAELGAIYLEKGIVETAESHAPEYLKKTQAERERDEKAAAKN